MSVKVTLLNFAERESNESRLQKDTDSNRRQKNFKDRNVKFKDKDNRHRRSRDNDEDEQANEVSTSEGAFKLASIQCYFCHERESHVGSECPNVNVTVDLKNTKYQTNAADNAMADRVNPLKKYRIV